MLRSFLIETAVASPPEVIDSFEWYEELAGARPELFAEPARGIDDPGYAALVIRPAYREEVRTTKATYASIVARQYSDGSSNYFLHGEHVATRYWTDTSLYCGGASYWYGSEIDCHR
jgi:hypothetical protein